MTSQLIRFLEDQHGQDLAEYSLLIVFVFLCIIGLAIGYGNNVLGITTVCNADLAKANTAVATGNPLF